MILILTVLEIVAPVFLLALIGFVWVKLGFEYRIEFVTKLAMTLAVPALIFTALMKTEIDPAALTTLSLASIAAYGAITLVALVATRLAGLNLRTYLAPLIFGNTGNLGLPLALFAFGEAGLGYAVVVFAVMAVWSFTFGVWIVAGGGAPTKALKEPVVLATLLGALFLWQGWHTPRFLTNALDLVGQLAIPLMLITLGVAVARLHPRGLGRAFALSLAKVAATVAIGFGIGRAFGLDHTAFAVLVLQVSTPVAVTSYMLAEKYEADSQAVAALVVTSTLTAVATIPLTLAFLV
ncbi:MAG TPA: AEC family transporter [Rhodobacterales bacterium]|nr:AEC family transporter [Rhodobacterales bacterium]